MNVVIAYDVSDNDRRARLAAILGGYGVRLQKSVFECLLDDDELASVLSTASALLNLDHDVLHVFRQCQACFAARREFGESHSPLHDLYWVI